MIVLLYIGWIIFSIILLFKIWDMTNDIKDIRNIMMNNVHNPGKGTISSNSNDESVNPVHNYEIGDIVINKSNGKEMRIVQLFPDGDIACVPTKSSIGLRKILKSDDIKPIEEKN